MPIPIPFARHLAATGLVLGVAACGGSDAAQLPPPNVTVVTTTATDIPASIELVGQGAASKFIEVRSQLNGVIIERPYREGSDVEAGTLLFRLDPTIYEATYRSAKAAADNARARLDNAQRTLNRLTPLLAEGAVSQKDVDDATTELQQAQAAYAEAQANADRAQKDFNDTNIRAEIPGRVGRAELPLGARVTGPADILTDLQQIDPIYVYFSPSDLELLRFRREQAEGKLVFPKGRLQVEVRLSDGTLLPSKGTLDFADLSLNARTGTQQFRAEFRNPQHILLPGQFVRVRILGVTRKGAILVPQRAVLQGLAGAFVYVVTEGDTARARTVTASTWEGNGWVIESGLNAGERVIVDGTQRVIAGQPVRIAPLADSTAADTTP
ncbi:MAG TPA: efflux RND transporter periplasmic adaptor subunit [Gemmatimonadales bacterium]|nr:efflux RND transporter periplasmic adaptor subunit [Gemmatimonadales bacterium]